MCMCRRLCVVCTCLDIPFVAQLRFMCMWRRLYNGAYGKAGNGNETETGNENWKQKWEQKTHQSLVQYFLHSVLSNCSSILFIYHYGTWVYESRFAFTPVLCFVITAFSVIE